MKVALADIPAQSIPAPKTAAEKRARFYNPSNAYNAKLPEVPNHTFSEEAALATAKDTSTGFIACDLATQLRTKYPATTPNLLVRYLRIKKGEMAEFMFNATAIMIYAIYGNGRLEAGSERIEWAAGDVMTIVGQTPGEFYAAEDSVLWVVTNEPQLAFERTKAPYYQDGSIVHYPRAEIERQFEIIYDASHSEKDPGLQVIFSSESEAETKGVSPGVMFGLNSLPPGAVQRSHVHAAAAVTLIVECENCFSHTGGVHKKWRQWDTTITPPYAPHSHHNEGGGRAYFLNVQDAGIFTYSRTLGFAFT